MQDGEFCCLDFFEQSPVDAGHHEPRFLGSAVLFREKTKCLLIEQVCLLGQVVHEVLKSWGVDSVQDFMGFDVKFLQCIDRDVDSPSERILSHISDDVGHLQSLSKGMSILRGEWVGLPKYLCRHLSNHPSDQVAIGSQSWCIKVAGLGQIHFTAFNDAVQLLSFDLKRVGQWHQGLHDRVLRLPIKGIDHLLFPPSQLGLSHAALKCLINDVINLSAKSIKRGDGRTLLRG